MYIKLGILEPSTSETAMAIATPYNKAARKVRVCINAPGLNAQVVLLPSNVPLHEELHMFVAGKRYIAKYDGRAGYLQIGVKPEFRKYFGITTPLGHYQYTRMPFGFVNAGAHYQRVMEDHIREFMTSMRQFIDDTLQADKEFEEYARVMRAFLLKCIARHYMMNAEKCEFLVPEVHYLGFLDGPDGQRIDPKRLEGIRAMGQPKDAKFVRRFLGICQFLARYVPELPRMVDPLWKALEGGDKKFVMTDAARAAYEEVRKVLLTGKALVQRKPNGQIYGRADGLTVVFASVAYQDGPDERSTGILGFYARKLRPKIGRASCRERV